MGGGEKDCSGGVENVMIVVEMTIVMLVSLISGIVVGGDSD